MRQATRSLVFWVALALAVYGAIHITPLLLRDLTAYPGPGVLSAILWLLYVAIFVLIVHRLELFEHRAWWSISLAFVWGAVVVAGIATTAAPEMHDLVDKLTSFENQEWVGAIAAPLTEEPLKLLGVVALAFLPGVRIAGPLDGLFYGIIVGLGFEATESFLYTAQGAAQEGGNFSVVVLIFLLRGVIGGLWSHPTYTGIAGAGVGYFFGSRSSFARRWLVMIGALSTSIALHGFFDSPLITSNPVLGSIVKGLPAVLLLILLIRLARNRERSAFRDVVLDQIPVQLISEAEMTSLLKRSSRKAERKEARHHLGWAGSHALHRVQRSQIDLICAAAEGQELQSRSDLVNEITNRKAELTSLNEV